MSEMNEEKVKSQNEQEKIKHSLAFNLFHLVLAAALISGALMLILGIGAYTYLTGSRIVRNSISITKSARDAMLLAAEPTTYAKKVMEIYKGMSEAERQKVGTKEYYEKFSKISKEYGYTRLNAILRSYKNANIADDVYYAVYDDETNAIVYVIDPEIDERDQCPAGHWETVKQREVSRFLAGAKSGEAFDVGNTKEYGWMVTSGVPLVNRMGEQYGYVLADNTLNHFVSSMKWFVILYSIVILILTILLETFLIHKMRKSVIYPINDIAEAAQSYVLDKKERKEARGHFKSLGIHTGDEIERLSNVMANMEDDLNAYEVNLAKVTSEKERISVELNLARKIQGDMLPNVFPPFPDRTEFDIFASMNPAKEVGGDFYDFFLVDDSHIAFLIADVSGKGIPAALFMMVTKSMLQTEIIEGKSPGEALTDVNSRICESEHEGMFVTVWVGVLDLKTGKLTASNAGHEYPVIKQPDEGYEVLHDKHCFVVGGIGGIKYSEYEVEMRPGSKIFLYTDGVPEATDAGNNMFGLDRMTAALNNARDANVTDTIKAVAKDAWEFVGDAEQFDDMTMLCLEYKGANDGGTVEGKMETLVDITLPAEIENQAVVTEKVDAELEKLECPFKQQAQLDIAIDELFSNIAKYAYAPGKGDATVRMEVSHDPKAVTLTFIDSGTPYDPMAQEDPDITLSAEERGIGGLGILMVKKSMDDLSYEYKDGKNIFRIMRIIEE